MPRTRNDILISAFLVLLLLWVVWEARSWPVRTRLFPWAIGFPVLALAMIQFGLACWKAIRERSYVDAVHTHGEPTERADAGRSGHQARLEVPNGEEAGVGLDPKLERERTISISAWTVAFALGFWLLGFKVGSLLLSLAFLRFQADESWKMSALYGLGVYLFFLVAFEMALGVPLAPGVIATSLELQSFDWYLVNPLLNVILWR
ncbi:MAG: tripartite tricarboxylate transporter TctB family protein [Deltaproteobacteria bacterium]|nr:tripartite tricarboxylate transporter TctB family protein [Deltaproteobacteria bacterium]